MPDQEAIVTLDDEPGDLSQPIVVRLDDEPPERKPSLAQTAAQRVKERDAEIAAAKAEAARATQRADHEARLRQQADTRSSQIESVSRTNQVAAIANAIEACKSERTAMRRSLSDAYAAGDHNLAAEISDKIVDIAARQSNLEAGKFEAEARAKQQPQVQRELPSDPVERFIAERNLPSASASWIRANPRAVEDADKLAYAHNKAIRGHALESPGYFAEVEKVMGLKEDDDPVVERDEPRQQRRAPAAPPSSGADRAIGRTASGGYVMTPAMREAAEISGVSEKEWLKAHLKIQENPGPYNNGEGKWTFSSADK